MLKYNVLFAVLGADAFALVLAALIFLPRFLRIVFD